MWKYALEWAPIADVRLSSDQAQSLQGGNANLAPEESESTTFGIVWTPSFLEDFSATVDWYEIEIEGDAEVGQRILDNIGFVV